MSYFITFTTSRKPEVFDDVKCFILGSNYSITIVYDNNSEELLNNVLGITNYEYNEG